MRFDYGSLWIRIDLGGLEPLFETCFVRYKVGLSVGAVLSVDIPGLVVGEQLCQLGVAAGCLRLKPEIGKDRSC